MGKDPDSPRGLALLHDPLLNKGTVFTERERPADLEVHMRSRMFDPHYESYVYAVRRRPNLVALPVFPLKRRSIALRHDGGGIE